jgi:hypothetical protein
MAYESMNGYAMYITVYIYARDGALHEGCLCIFVWHVYIVLYV